MRIKLVLALAEAIAFACDGLRVTYSNCRRYVTRDYLTAFGIRRNTEIRSAEWIRALSIAQSERRTRVIDNLPFAHIPDRNRIRLCFVRDLVSTRQSV